jgi:hypothetical protein
MGRLFLVLGFAATLIGSISAQTRETPPQATPAEPAVAATVNGEAIPLAAVDAVLKTWPTGRAPLKTEQLKLIRRDILDALIDDALHRQHLAKHGAKVAPEVVEKVYAGMVENARRAGKSPAEFFREVGGEPRLRADIVAALQSQELASAQATPEALKRLYEANKDEFDGVRVRVGMVMLRVTPGGPPGERAAAVEKLKALRADLYAGKMSFADAARRHSIDATAAAGGDAGFVTRRDPNFDEEFCRAAFALPAGGVSEPVETPRAVYLIQATERRAGTPTTYEQVSEQVLDLFFADYHRRLTEQLRKAATISVTLP